MSSSEEEDVPAKANQIKRIKFQYEDGRFTIKEIYQKFPFPVTVVCDTSKCPVPVEKSSITLDLRQPLLFYRKRNIQKVPARSMFFDDESKEYKEIGEPLLIPEDYKGMQKS